MKRSITRWTTTLATAALLGLPAVGMAQTPQPPTGQPPATQPTTTPPPTAPPQQQAPPPAEPSPTPQPTATAPPSQSDAAVAPEEHLRQAKAALDAIQPATVTGRARTQLTELRRHLNALDKASTAGAASSTGSASPSAAAAKGRSNANWGTEVAAIDKILTEMTAGDATAVTGTTGATGTSGTTRSKPAAAVTLDDATRARLMEVRTHITAYAAAMSGAPATPKNDDAMAANAAGAQAGNPAVPTGSAAPAGSSPPAGSMTAGATTPSAPPASTTAQAPGAQPSAEIATQSEATAQVDADAARRHLTAARDTLSQLTKLPAAAQLSGDARAQVGQLISNFNELITTQSQWRASYGKVAANLDALLGPDAGAQAEAQSPAITPPNPEAAPAPGASPAATPGAVGTSGTASAPLDPAIREKLIELRNNLREFEKASAGAEQK